jgi:hypothetical protein
MFIKGNYGTIEQGQTNKANINWRWPGADQE